METILITHSEEETLQLGVRLASVLKLGDIIALSGSLGAGKTSFVHGIGKGLGILEAMPSPTFAIMRTYSLQPVGELLHLDAYRLHQQDSDHGLDEPSSQSIMCVEWAEHVPLLFQQACLFVQIHVVGPTQRHLRFTYHEVRFQKVLEHDDTRA
jgi:tRNA threonylcarbamoyladenosine biosynthesis protein TsaE